MKPALVTVIAITISMCHGAAVAAGSTCTLRVSDGVELREGGGRVASYRFMDSNQQVVELKILRKSGRPQVVAMDLTGETERWRYVYWFPDGNAANYSTTVTKLLYSAPLYAGDAELVAIQSTSLLVCEGRLRNAVGSAESDLPSVFEKAAQLLRESALESRRN